MRDPVALSMRTKEFADLVSKGRGSVPNRTLIKLSSGILWLLYEDKTPINFLQGIPQLSTLAEQQFASIRVTEIALEVMILLLRICDDTTDTFFELPVRASLHCDV